MSVPTPPKPSMGVLHLNQHGSKFRLTRHAPSVDLQPFIKHYWIINWDLTGQPPHNQEVVPNPCVNLVVQTGRTAFYGVPKGVHSHHLKDTGVVFGAKFKPGGFYPFYKQSLSGLTGKSVATEQILGIGAADMERIILSESTPEEMISRAEEMLLPCLPSPDETIALIQTIVDFIQTNRQVTTAQQLCEFSGLGMRALQRMFSQYIGVSPKWIIKLYRLQNAAEMMDYGSLEDGVQLAMELGYYDQSHFIRDFKSFVGKTPEQYMNMAKQG